MQSENYSSLANGTAIETIDAKNVSSSFSLNPLCIDFYFVILNENEFKNLRFNSFQVNEQASTSKMLQPFQKNTFC